MTVYVCVFVSVLLGIEPRASHILDQNSATKLYSQLPKKYFQVRMLLCVYVYVCILHMFVSICGSQRSTLV